MSEATHSARKSKRRESCGASGRRLESAKEMFEIREFLWCIKLETGCLIIAWVNYILSLITLWLGIFDLVFEIFAFTFGIGKVRVLLMAPMCIAIGAVLKFTYRRFIDDIEKRDRSIVIWPLVHHFIAIFTIIPLAVLFLFILGITSDAVYITVIALDEIVNLYCLIVFWSLYKKFQHGMPLTNEI